MALFIQNTPELTTYFSPSRYSATISKYSCAFPAKPFFSLFRRAIPPSRAKYLLPSEVSRAWSFRPFPGHSSTFCHSWILPKFLNDLFVLPSCFQAHYGTYFRSRARRSTSASSPWPPSHPCVFGTSLVPSGSPGRLNYTCFMLWR